MPLSSSLMRRAVRCRRGMTTNPSRTFAVSSVEHIPARVLPVGAATMSESYWQSTNSATGSLAGFLMLCGVLSTSSLSDCDRQKGQWGGCGNTSTLCEHDAEGIPPNQEEELPVYASSSDPILFPMEGEDEFSLSEISFRPIPFRKQAELADESSTFNRSVRAFGTSMDSTVESFVPTSSSGPPLATSGTDSSPSRHKPVLDTPLERVESLQQLHGSAANGAASNSVTTKRMYFYRTGQLESEKKQKFVLLAGPSSSDLGGDIGHLLGVPVSKMDVSKFVDGETAVQLQVSVRGKHVYIVNSTTSTDAIMELLLLATALRRASARKITAIIPYYGTSHRADLAVGLILVLHVSHSASNASTNLSWFSRILPTGPAQDKARTHRGCGHCPHAGNCGHRSGHLHGFAQRSGAGVLPTANSSRGALLLSSRRRDIIVRRRFRSLTPPPPPPRRASQHLMPAPVAAAYFHEELSALVPPEGNADPKYYPAVTVVASHESQVGRASQFRSVLQRLSGVPVEIAVLSRTQMRPGERQYEPNLVGNVRGRKCILVDDIVNTGTTLVSNIKQLKQEGAESIYAWATHGVFGTSTVPNDAPERLQEQDDLQYLLISNSVANPCSLPSKIRLLNVAPLLAEAISRALNDQSISSILSLDPVQQLERYDA